MACLAGLSVAVTITRPSLDKRKERRAGRRTVDDRERPPAWRKPLRELGVGHVRPAQVELRLLPVEHPVTDQNDPQVLVGAIRFQLRFDGSLN